MFWYLIKIIKKFTNKLSIFSENSIFMIKLTYIVYLILSIVTVLYVGNFCYQNGKTYILNYFPTKVKFANAINNSLRIAYYCLNVGLAIYTLNSLKEITELNEAIIEISLRFSYIVLVIAVLHFINIITIYFIYKHFKNK